MLENLTTKKNIRAFSISPENPTGKKGMGAMMLLSLISFPPETYVKKLGCFV